MSTLIGDKNKFAIEYKQYSNPKMGYNRIWINSKYIGCIDDLIYFSYLQGGLLLILNKQRRRENLPFDFLRPEEFMQKAEALESNFDDEIEKYQARIGGGFDDFFVYYFLDGANIHFIWQLEKEPNFEYKGYPHRAQSGQVDFNYFKQITEEFFRITD